MKTTANRTRSTSPTAKTPLNISLILAAIIAVCTDGTLIFSSSLICTKESFIISVLLRVIVRSPRPSDFPKTSGYKNSVEKYRFQYEKRLVYDKKIRKMFLEKIHAYLKAEDEKERAKQKAREEREAAKAAKIA